MNEEDTNEDVNLELFGNEGQLLHSSYVTDKLQTNVHTLLMSENVFSVRFLPGQGVMLHSW